MAHAATYEVGKSQGTLAESEGIALKDEVEHFPHIESVVTAGTMLSGPVYLLPKEHQEYLLERHGTLDLDPLPGFGGADPYNWPKWKKVTNLVLVAFHAMMGTLTAGVIVPAYSSIATDLNVTLQQSSYLTSLQIAILGAAPLFWKPLSNRWGRRPIFLLSMICSLVTNVGCAKSPTYATMAVCRALNAFFISPAGALGSVVVAESFFSRERARYMGVWTLLVTCGIPVGPLVFGFVTTRIGYRWIYWILAMINALQFVTYFLFGPETRYLRRGAHHGRSEPTIKREYLNIFMHRIDDRPIKPIEFIQPLFLARHLFILIPACAYAMNFLWGTILMTVEIPQLFQEKFNLDAEQIGLQFIASIIGSVIGEQFGGILSDVWMARRSRTKLSGPNNTKSVAPEYRLWLSYAGFALTVIGVIVFLVQTQFAQTGQWNVTPLIGVAIGATGNQIVTTVLITYAVDCLDRESAASVGVFITFVRQIWGFIGPFWFPSMFEHVGVAKSAGVGVALIIGVSIMPTLWLQLRGHLWRDRVLVVQQQ